MSLADSGKAEPGTNKVVADEDASRPYPAKSLKKGLQTAGRELAIALASKVHRPVEGGGSCQSHSRPIDLAPKEAISYEARHLRVDDHGRDQRRTRYALVGELGGADRGAARGAPDGCQPFGARVNPPPRVAAKKSAVEKNRSSTRGVTIS